jgi:hypothetical protein
MEGGCFLVVSLLYLLFRRALAVAALRLRSREFKGALGERPGGELGAVVGMDHRPAGGVASLDRHPERVAAQRGGRVVADRPADHAAAERASSTTAQ